MISPLRITLSALVGIGLAPTAPGQSVELLMASDAVPGYDELSNPKAIASSPDGSTWVAGWTSHNLYRIDADGTVTGVFQRWAPMRDPSGVVCRPDGSLTVATLVALFEVRPDGEVQLLHDNSSAPPEAQLLGGQELVGAGDGTLWVVSEGTDQVLRRDPDGTVSAVIGPADGLDDPSDLARDAAGNLYVPGRLSDNLFRVAPDGSVVELIGPDGDGAGHGVNGPSAVAVSPGGVVFLASMFGDVVLKRSISGVITPVLTDAGAGPGFAAGNPADLALAADGTLYVACIGSDNVFSISPTGTVTEILDVLGDGQGHLMADPVALALAADGTLYVASAISETLLSWKDGVVEHVADIPDFSQSPSTGAGELALDDQDRLLISYPFGDRVDRLEPGGGFTTLIDGEGGIGNTFSSPVDVAVDLQGRALVAVGEVWRFAASGSGLFEIVVPSGPDELVHGAVELVGAPDGRVLVLGQGSANVVALHPDGTLEELWATADGGPGRELDAPVDLALGVDGSLYVANQGGLDLLVRRPSGQIEQLLTWEDVHPPTTSNAAGFTEVAVDPLGRVYTRDDIHRAVLRVDPTGAVTVIDEPVGTEQLWSLDVEPGGALHVGVRTPWLSIPDRVRRHEPSGAVSVVASDIGDGVEPLTTPGRIEGAGPGRFLVTGYSSHNAFVVDLGFCGGFTLLPSALPGDGSGPLLVGEGPLCAGSTWQLGLTGAPASVSGVLVLGYAELAAPFQGGLLVPRPDLLLPLATDAAGRAPLTGSWPAAVPAGASAWLQAWFLPGGGSPAVRASNGLRLDML